MDNDVRVAIEKALHIPSEPIHQGQVTPIDLYLESGYDKSHEQITVKSIQTILTENPHLSSA